MTWHKIMAGAVWWKPDVDLRASLPMQDTERQQIFEAGWKEGQNSIIKELLK